MEHTFLHCKQYVGAGINTLLSTSDGLGSSILCRKIEKARPLREGIDRKVVFFSQESAFLVLMFFINYKVRFRICTLTLRVNTYVSSQRRGVNRRKESSKIRKSFYYFIVLTIIPTIVKSLHCKI